MELCFIIVTDRFKRLGSQHCYSYSQYLDNDTDSYNSLNILRIQKGIRFIKQKH